MFTHEAPYDCTFCGTSYCYGECRNDGVDIIYGGDKRNMEILPALQTTLKPQDGLRARPESDGRPTPALPEVSSGLPATTKSYSRHYLARRYRPSQQDFDTIRAMEHF